MKLLELLLVGLLVLSLFGCNNSENAEGVSPDKDTEAIAVRSEDAYYELVPNPLTKEAKADAKAKRDAILAKLVIKDEVVGEGEAVKERDTVRVHYTGMLKNGKVFDTSLKGENPKPFVVQLGQRRVIEGWDLGLVGMKVGGKRHLEIPPELGYGERDMGPIPGNSTLIFEVELIGIGEEPKKDPQAF